MINNLRQVGRNKKNRKTSKNQKDKVFPGTKENPSQGTGYRRSPEGVLNVIRHILYITTIIIAPPLYVSHRIVGMERMRMLLAACIIIFGVLTAIVSDKGIKRLIEEQKNGKRAMQTDGIFSVSRHPFYTSQTIIMIGVIALFPSWTTIGTFLFYGLMTWLTMKEEEENMIKEFGEEYRKYRSETPIFPTKIWRLIFP